MSGAGSGKGTKTSSSICNTEEDEETELRRGPWTIEEDTMLIHYIACNGEGRWNMLAKCAGLKRTGKSCRLRWLNYLKPDVKRGNLSPQEQLLILELHAKWGNRWSKIAQHLPGRTDNEIKNFWRTRVQKQARKPNPEMPDNQQLPSSAFSQSNSSASSSAMSAQENNIIPTVSNMSPPSNWHDIFSCNIAATPALGESSSSSFPQAAGVADHHHTTSPSHLITYGNNLYNPFHNEDCYYVDNNHAADASGGYGLGEANLATSGGHAGRRDWVVDDEVANGMWNNTDELWQFR